jgi:hypothetical protein
VSVGAKFGTKAVVDSRESHKLTWIDANESIIAVAWSTWTRSTDRSD